VSAAYLDTSCLVAVAFGEPGHESLAARLDGVDQLFSSNLLEAELRAALRREGVGGGEALIDGLSWVLPDRPLTPEIEAVLGAGSLRGADAWHLACALYLSPDPGDLEFLTLDRRQGAVAASLGFPGGDLDAA
jgi:predicted nucleic acid-binding protein